jgi:Skp family chaperone for outer membrane proteins
MTFRHLTLAATALMFAAPQAFAQAPAAAQPAVTAPAIPGICVFSQEIALRNSAVGKYVGQRLQQINQQSNAELNAQKTAIETEAKTLEGQRATLAESAFSAQASALNQKLNQFQQLVNTRSREVELTEARALQRIGQDLTPLITDVVRTRNCAVLLDRSAVFAANPAMDITTDVVTRLDAKLTQFPFERERLDQQQPQAAAGAAAPAAASAGRPRTR